MRVSIYNIRSASEIQAIVDSVAEQRALMLRWWSQRSYPIVPADDLVGGKLLLFAPGDSLFDGAAGNETDGFFNDENEPPWDTWLCYAEEWYLVSWVPPQLIELADGGI